MLREACPERYEELKVGELIHATRLTPWLHVSATILTLLILPASVRSLDTDSLQVKTHEFSELEVKPTVLVLPRPVYPEDARKGKLNGKVRPQRYARPRAGF